MHSKHKLELCGRAPACTRDLVFIYCLARYTSCPVVINEKFIWQTLPHHDPRAAPDSSSGHLLEALHVLGTMQLCKPSGDADLAERSKGAERMRSWYALSWTTFDQVFHLSHICWGSSRCQPLWEVLQSKGNSVGSLPLGGPCLDKDWPLGCLAQGKKQSPEQRGCPWMKKGVYYKRVYDVHTYGCRQAHVLVNA